MAKKSFRVISWVLAIALFFSLVPSTLITTVSAADKGLTLTVKSNISDAGLSYTPMSETYSDLTVNDDGTLVIPLDEQGTIDFFVDTDTGIHYTTDKSTLASRLRLVTPASVLSLMRAKMVIKKISQRHLEINSNPLTKITTAIMAFGRPATAIRILHFWHLSLRISLLKSALKRNRHLTAH